MCGKLNSKTNPTEQSSLHVYAWMNNETLRFLDQTLNVMNRGVSFQVDGKLNPRHYRLYWTPNTNIGIARTLNKLRTSKGDSASLQLRPFSNGNFVKSKEFAPRGSEFFPLKAVPNGMENHFYTCTTLDDLPCL